MYLLSRLYLHDFKAKKVLHENARFKVLDCMRKLWFRVSDCMRKLWFTVNNCMKKVKLGLNHAVLMQPYFKPHLFHAVTYYKLLSSHSVTNCEQHISHAIPFFFGFKSMQKSFVAFTKKKGLAIMCYSLCQRIMKYKVVDGWYLLRSFISRFPSKTAKLIPQKCLNLDF